MCVTWRHLVLMALVLTSALGMASLDPIAQNLAYHSFADTRPLLGIPNFGDVASNLPFLLVGVLGLRLCLRMKSDAVRQAWIALFGGITLVSIGSSYYHWDPTNDTLVWDRLPMTIAFMGLFVALLSENVDRRLARVLLVPALAFGLAANAVFRK